MNSILFQKLLDSLRTGFIDHKYDSDIAYRPEIITNNKLKGEKVLSTILNELDTCDEFYFNVAFITTGGVASIINKLKELEHKNINGYIIASQYLNFTHPEALKQLLKFNNIQLKIATSGDSHSKGYIFRKGDFYNLIIGSSNLTQNALSCNNEWNLKISGYKSSAIILSILNEFHKEYEKSTFVTNDFISDYEQIYKSNAARLKTNNTAISPDQIKPNLMQLSALENLINLRKQKKDKALLISATGTGKTYLSAFDVKTFNPKTFLFVVHRLTIANEAMETFKNIFGNYKTMGIYSGNKLNLEADFLFSTIQTISKPEHFQRFSKEHFDYIVIDETHRVSSQSYNNILSYFKPKFLLGMTATPERTDGDNVFKIFDYNIAYEIRLHKALEENMLCPFHYYGITDLSINNEIINEKSDFNKLTSKERVEKIIAASRLYSTCNGIVRGLVFCNRQEVSRELANEFNLAGYKSVSLDGNSTEEERQRAIENLETDDSSKKIDYIFTVDIFNEGIDIPKVNQIIMLRPTQSAIVFVQQLGRGLRKTEDKDYLTVIDFIGNYQNNFLVPVALYGDNSYNKDNLRKLLATGSNLLPGASTINFDLISKQRIFEAINTARLDDTKDLKNDYFLLKYKIGRIPLMVDFIEHGSRDPIQFVTKFRSYYNFLLKYENDLENTLNEKQIRLIELFSLEINNSVRVEESIILKELIINDKLSVPDFNQFIKTKYGYTPSENTLLSCINNINFNFITETVNNKLVELGKNRNINTVILKDNILLLHEDMKDLLKNKQFHAFLLDSANYSIDTFNKQFIYENFKDGFILYKKYSRKDVFRVLNWPKNPVAQNVGGYMISNDLTNCPIFVTYHKSNDISETTKYEDKFIDRQSFQWMSKNNRSLKSNDVTAIKSGNLRLPLFIKKSDDEGIDFYYMGDMIPDQNSFEEKKIRTSSDKIMSVVQVKFTLQNIVDNNIYNYLTTSTIEEKSAVQVEKPAFEIIAFNENQKCIPIFENYAAAGEFSELQHSNQMQWARLLDNVKSPDDYFICKVVGESMNQIIPNNSWCLFRKYTGGSRNDKIVLVKSNNFIDSEFGSRYTVKKYKSEKFINSDSWSHNSIQLIPLSNNKEFKTIELKDDSDLEFTVIGIFEKILPTP